LITIFFNAILSAMSKPKSSAQRTCSFQPAAEAAMEGKAGNPLRRALWLDALDRQLRPHLPPQLAHRCRLANINGEQLVFLVDSPVWHAKLRLAEHQLIDAARSIGLTVTRVTVKTATTALHPATQARPEPHKPVSAATHKGLRAALASLQDIAPAKRG
jgi:hypothetical protein